MEENLQQKQSEMHALHKEVHALFIEKKHKRRPKERVQQQACPVRQYVFILGGNEKPDDRPGSRKPHKPPAYHSQSENGV